MVGISPLQPLPLLHLSGTAASLFLTASRGLLADALAARPCFPCRCPPNTIPAQTDFSPASVGILPANVYTSYGILVPRSRRALQNRHGNRLRKQTQFRHHHSELRFPDSRNRRRAARFLPLLGGRKSDALARVSLAKQDRPARPSGRRNAGASGEFACATSVDILYECVATASLLGAGFAARVTLQSRILASRGSYTT